MGTFESDVSVAAMEKGVASDSFVLGFLRRGGRFLYREWVVTNGTGLKCELDFYGFIGQEYRRWVWAGTKTSS